MSDALRFHQDVRGPFCVWVAVIESVEVLPREVKLMEATTSWVRTSVNFLGAGHQVCILYFYIYFRREEIVTYHVLNNSHGSGFEWGFHIIVSLALQQHPEPGVVISLIREEDKSQRSWVTCSRHTQPLNVRVGMRIQLHLKEKLMMFIILLHLLIKT